MGLRGLGWMYPISSIHVSLFKGKKKIFIGVSTFMSLNKNKYISIDCSYYAWFHAR